MIGFRGVATCWVLVTFGAAMAQESVQGVPEPEDVLAAFIEARGGVEAVEAVEGVLRASTWTVGDTSGSLRTIESPGGLFKSVLKVDGSTWQEMRGANGNVAWLEHGPEACFILGPSDALIEQLMHDVRWPLDHETYFASIQVLGREQVVDRPAWKLRMTPRQGEPISAWFDVDTGLLRRIDVVSTGSDGTPWVVETTFDQWGPTGELLWPTAVRRKTPSGTISFAITTTATPASVSLRVLPACVQKELANRPPPPKKVGDHARLREMIGPVLLDRHGKEVSSDILADKADVLLYFSALWCPPCKVFTPKLVKVYDDYVQDGTFEVLLISSDRSADKMIEYMNQAGMNWYAVPWDRVTPSGIKQIWGSGRIPNLVWLDSLGDTVSAAYTANGRRGVDAVLFDFKKGIGAD